VGFEDRRASIGFIDYIAVQEPEHDPFEENDEFALVSCLGPTNTSWLGDGSSELLRDELAYCVDLNEYIGRRRVGVLF
jgi:hypothetical protein